MFLPYNPANAIPGHLFQRNESLCSHKNHAGVLSADPLITDWKRKQASYKMWITAYAVVHAYPAIHSAVTRSKLPHYWYSDDTDVPRDLCCVQQADPSQGPLEPGALHAALSLGGQATAEGALLLPFASLWQSFHCWSPWQCATHQPLSPPQGRLGPKCKGKGKNLWNSPCVNSLFRSLPRQRTNSSIYAVFLWSRVKLLRESDWLTLDHYHLLPRSTHTQTHFDSTDYL